MKFNVPCKSLYAAAAGVSKVISQKNAMSILDNFLLEVSGETLTITGSDMENSLSTRVAISDVEGELRFCVGARRLVDLLKELPAQGITFEVDDTTYQVVISYTGGKYTLVAINGADYPGFRQSDDDGAAPVSFVISGDKLVKGLENTTFAASNDDFHPIMQGVYIDVHDNDITFVATDSHKLVRYIDRRIAPGVTAACVMPMKPCNVLKAVVNKDEDLKVTMTKKNATIESDSITFRCTFLNGRYPDYNKVIPQNYPYTMTIDRASFLNAVRRVGIFVDPGFGLMKFRITPQTIFLKCDDVNLCTTAREQVPCSYDGAELAIGFSSPFLIEILQTLATEQVEVKFADQGRPGLFSPGESEEGVEMLVLLMPINIDGF